MNPQGPVSYVVMSLYRGDEEVAGVGTTLKRAIRGRESPDSMWGWRIYAIFADEDDMRLVPKEAYAEPDPPSRDEALEFIRDRAAQIAAGSSWASALGCMRCIDTHPEEKQVADYIGTANWKLRAEPDEDWWTQMPVSASLEQNNL